MPTDDRSFPAQGQAYTAPSGETSRRESDELYDTAERLERSSWDRMQSEAHAHDADPGESERPGPIMSFLEHQLDQRPLPTLLLAVAAGWLAGKLLR